MLFVTPDHAAVRELFYASTVCGGSRRSESLSLLRSLVLDMSRKARKCAFSVRIGGGHAS